MNGDLPSANQEPIVKNKLLYMGTTLFQKLDEEFNEKDITLAYLQETIAQRYPTDGSNFSKGIETTLSIYPSGLQMEHSSTKNDSSTSALFFYPIKSLVYAGALKFGLFENGDPRSGKFMPLDSNVADTNQNAKYPPLFVVLVKGFDIKMNSQIVECHVFVVSSKKTSKFLLKGCKKAFEVENNLNGQEFLEKFGSIPLAYDMDKGSPKQVNNNIVKVYDQNGYYYALKYSAIDVWQLFESPDQMSGQMETFDPNNTESVKWLTSKNDLVDSTKKTDYELDVKELLERDELMEENFLAEPPKILVRKRNEPQPVIIEKYITKKQPQVIIKEIYVIEPARPPIKYVQKLEGVFNMPNNYLPY